MTRLGIAFLMLALAAFSSSPPPLVAVAPPVRVGPPRGIDMPIDARDVSNDLRGSQLDFVARYYRDPASRRPTLSAGKAALLSSSGFKIVAIWESHSHQPQYFSYAAGFADAVTAYRQARAVGQPFGSAIYFGAQQPDIYAPVDRYFRGVAAGLAVCGYLKHMRLAQYAWLSNSRAWTGYNDFSTWNIRQLPASATLSFGHDWNEATEDYGGFQVKSQFTAL
jgi:hypothetical protein